MSINQSFIACIADIYTDYTDEEFISIDDMKEIIESLDIDNI